MPADEPKLAVLDDEAVAKVRALEEELGDNVVVVAYDRPLEPANLTAEQLEKVQDVEYGLVNTYLVAYRRPKAEA